MTQMIKRRVLQEIELIPEDKFSKSQIGVIAE